MDFYINRGSTLPHLKVKIFSTDNTEFETLSKVIKTAKVTFSLKNITNNVYLVKDATIAPGGALVPVGGDQKLVLEAGDYLQVNTSIASAGDVIVSILEIT